MLYSSYMSEIISTHQNESTNSHMIFVIYGVSGSGKSALLETVKSLSSRVDVHKKDTTRKLRPKELDKAPTDMDFKEVLNEDDYVLTYEHFGNKYGIRGDQLNRSFENRKLHFIIIAEVDAIKRFKKLYTYAEVIYVHYDPVEIPKNFRDRDTLEYSKRKDNIEQQYRDFIENNTLFNHVVVNFWDLGNARTQLKNIINLYDKEF